MSAFCSLTANACSSQEKLLFDGLFKDFEVHPSHYEPSYDSLHTREDFTCIIDTPEITLLDHPMLGFDVTQVAEKILSTAKAVGSNRKPFHALMSGRGSGKSRTICELRTELLKDHFQCLPIAITFNLRWETFFFRSETGNVKTRSTKIDLALEVVIRMASILYGVEADELFPIMEAKENFSQLKSFLSRGLIRGFIKHAVDRVEMKGKKVDYFILLIDESLRLASGIEGDTYSDIRGALLDTTLSDRFHTGVAMTSLAAAPISRTISGRGVASIEKPSKLPIDQTLISWLKIKPTPSSRLLLALLAPNPRSVQIFYNNILKTSFANQQISTQNFYSLFQNLNETLLPAYKGAEFPSDDLLFQILFCDQILLTSEVEAMITHSVFTNVLDGAHIDVTKIFPEPSVLIMYSSLVNAHDSEVVIQFKRTVDRTLQQLSVVRKDNVDTVLEVLFFEYLCLRILSTNSGERKVSPAQLLGIKLMTSMGIRLKNLLASNISLFRPEHLVDTMAMTPPSLNDTEEFSQFIGDLPRGLSIGLWKSAKGDPYDFLLMLRLDEFIDPFFFFFEIKSPNVWPDDNDRKEMIFTDRTQFVKSRAMLKRVTDKLPHDALLKADGYLYAYFVADDDVVSKFYEDSGRLVISGKEAQKFLRAFRDFYKAIRSLITDPIAKL